LGSDPDVRAGLIAQATKLVADFSWPAIAEHYEVLYAKSLAARNEST